MRFNTNKYDVYLNNTLIFKDKDTNIFSIFDLTPSTHYVVKVIQNSKECINEFDTDYEYVSLIVMAEK